MIGLWVKAFDRCLQSIRKAYNDKVRALKGTVTGATERQCYEICASIQKDKHGVSKWDVIKSAASLPQDFAAAKTSDSILRSATARDVGTFKACGRVLIAYRDATLPCDLLEPARKLLLELDEITADDKLFAEKCEKLVLPAKSVPGR